MDAITCVRAWVCTVRTLYISRFGLVSSFFIQIFVLTRTSVFVCVVCVLCQPTTNDAICDGKTGLKKMQRQCKEYDVRNYHIDLHPSSFLIEER